MSTKIEERERHEHERDRAGCRVWAVERVIEGIDGGGARAAQACAGELTLLWQILSGAGFPNQFFCDS
jgi:hypothetical protein